jgi:hypothetical protein
MQEQITKLEVKNALSCVVQIQPAVVRVDQTEALTLPLLWENFKNCGHCSINYEPTD